MSVSIGEVGGAASVGVAFGEEAGGPEAVASDFVGHVIAFFFGPEPVKDLLLAGQVLDEAMAGMQVAPSDGGVAEKVVAGDLEELFRCAGADTVEEALAWSVGVLWGRPIEEGFWDAVIEVSRCGWFDVAGGRIEVAKRVFTAVLSAYHASLWRMLG